MRRFTKLQRNLIIINLSVLIFGCVMLSLRQNSLSNLGYSAWTYLKYGLIDEPITSLGNFFKDFASLWHVYEDNEYLNAQLASEKSYRTLYDQERNKNKELEGLLEMKNAQQSAWQVTGWVISRPSQSWNQTCTISAGSASGVEKNMLVVSSEGAVGLIEDVQTNTSTVALFTSNELPNDISVLISMEDGSTVEGVMRGYDAAVNRYQITLFDPNATVAAGQSVSTGGKGGNIPSGILVGTVTKVEMNDDSIISTVYVAPVQNISSFDYVNVIGSGVVEP